MSHLRSIGRNLNAAAECREYFARLHAERQARSNARKIKDGGVKTFDSAIDPDRDFTHERGHDPGGADQSEPGESATSEQNGSSTSSKVHTRRLKNACTKRHEAESRQMPPERERRRFIHPPNINPADLRRNWAN
jgi:hypothetical protein